MSDASANIHNATMSTPPAVLYNCVFQCMLMQNENPDTTGNSRKNAQV